MKPSQNYNNDIQIDPNLFLPPKPANKKEEENQRMTEYYKMKIAEIEKERIEWMTKLEALNQNTQDFYAKEWELRKLTDEITELQQSLSEAISVRMISLTVFLSSSSLPLTQPENTHPLPLWSEKSEMR